jgi:hypothetical protein
MRVVVACALSLTACEARVGVATGTDASPDSQQLLPDTGDAPPACIKRALFLSFEGETLTDAPASDAKQNLASWMTNGVTSATAPPYLAGNANRATIIQGIVNEVTNRVAGFTTVVTTRPVDGDYMMIVFGGDRLALGSRFRFVQELDCGDQVRNDVAWVDDTFPLASVPNAVLGSIGFGIGLTATLDPTDCMCAWDNACTPNTNNCVFHNGIARDPDANQQCPGAPAVMDEIVEVNAAFCQ